MATFTFVFIFGLIALQGSMVFGSVSTAANIKLLAKQLNDKTISLPTEVYSLSDKINELVAKHNLDAVFVSMNDDIEALLATSEQDERLCGPKAHQMATELSKESQAEAQQCVTRTQEVVASLEEEFKPLEVQVHAVTDLLQDKIHICSKQNQRNVLGFVECLEENTKDLKQTLEELDHKVMQVNNVALKTTQDALSELDTCLAKIENKVSLEGRAIVYGLNQCIDNVELLYTKNLPNNVEEIVAKYNLNALIKEIRESVANLLKTSEDERLCGRKAHQLIEEISKSSQAEAGLCMSLMGVSLMDSQDALKEFDLCLSRVENKITFEGLAIVDGLNQCIKNEEMLYSKSLLNDIKEIMAKHNPNALIVKLKEDIEELLKTSEDNRLCGPKAHELVEEITKTSKAETGLCMTMTLMAMSHMDPQDVLNNLDLCMSSVENKVSLKGRALVDGLNQCIKNEEMLYIKNLPNNIEEVVAKHNLEALIVEMKKDIENLLKTSEDERLCGRKAHQLVEDISKTSQAETELCMSIMGVSLMDSQDALKELDLCMSRVENKVSFERLAIVDGLNQCINNEEMLYAKNLPNNVEEIVAKHNLKALIAEMEKDIKNLFKTSKDERLCGPKAHQLIEKITKTSQVEAELCISTMGGSLMDSQNALKELDNCFSKIENEVSLEGRAIVYGLNQCIDNIELLYTKNLPTNVEEIVAKHNLKDLIAEMEKDIKNLFKTNKDERLCGPKAHQLIGEITKTSQVEAELCISTMGVSLMNSQDALKELDNCFAKIENQVSLEGRAIVYGLNQCIDNIELLYTKNLPTNVEEIVAKHNLRALIAEMEKDIEKLFKTSKDERLCGPKAHQLIEEITKTSQVEAELCLSTMGVSLMNSQDALKELDNCFAKIENQVSLEGRAIVYGLNQCIDNIELLYSKNLPNNVEEIVAKHNLKALLAEMEKDIKNLFKTSKAERLCGPKAHQLIEKITKTSQVEAEVCLSTMGVSLKNSKDALKELDNCFAKIENAVSLEGRAIVYGLNQCIDNIELLYTKNLPNTVEEVVAKHNLKALIAEMEKEIENLFKTNKEERLCGPKAHQLIEEISKTSQVEAGLCLSTMDVSLMDSQDALKELDNCFAKIENEVSLEGRAIVYGLNQCIDNIEMLY